MKNYFIKAFLALFLITFTFSVEAKSAKSEKQSHSKAQKHRGKAKQQSQKQHVTKATEQATKAGSVKFAPGQITHIKDRHWHNANPAQQTSRFNQSMTVGKLHNLAVKTIKEGAKSDSKHGQGRVVHEYRFNKPIGKTTAGKDARTLRVVTSPKGEIVTSFPVR